MLKITLITRELTALHTKSRRGSILRPFIERWDLNARNPKRPRQD